MSLWTLGTTFALRSAAHPRAALDATAPAQPASAAEKNLDSLAKYIPAETTTAFLAALGLLGGVSLDGKVPHLEWLLYAICALLTPALVYLSARVTWKSNATDGAPFVLPVWRMVAATIAFLIWALAVPGLIPDKAFAALAAIGAILVSPIFFYVEKAFGLDT
jgi:hypothetical protein